MKRASWLASGGAALGAYAAPALGQANPRINIAITADDASAEPLYAKEQGFFTSVGLDATVDVLANGGAIISALMGGSTDIGSSNLVSVVAGFKKGLPVKIVAPASVYDSTVPQVALVVLKQSPLRTAKDLEGKTVATNPIRGISSLATALWMQKNAADPSTVKWVEMPRGEMASAMVQGHIDAATLTEPFITLNAGLTRMIVAPYEAVARRFLTVVFIATAQWAANNPERLQRFVAAMRRSAAWANANQKSSGTILAASSKMDPDLVHSMSRVRYGDNLVAAEIQPCIELAAQNKLIDGPFSAQDIIYRP